MNSPLRHPPAASARPASQIRVAVTRPACPSALKARCYRGYLREWFDWKKSVNRHFSHRVFARLTGFKSPSLLLRVMQGERNLTHQTLPAVIRAMALGPEEAAAFGALVRASWAESRTRA